MSQIYTGTEFLAIWLCRYIPGKEGAARVMLALKKGWKGLKDIPIFPDRLALIFSAGLLLPYSTPDVATSVSKVNSTFTFPKTKNGLSKSWNEILSILTYPSTMPRAIDFVLRIYQWNSTWLLRSHCLEERQIVSTFGGKTGNLVLTFIGYTNCPILEQKGALRFVVSPQILWYIV